LTLVLDCAIVAKIANQKRRGPRMNILVAGGFDENDKRAEAIRSFAKALGEAIGVRGHILLNGSLTELDSLIAEALSAKLENAGLTAKERETRIVSYALAGTQPAHGYGTVLRSRLTDWEIAKESFYIPEQVQQADVVILVAGFDGTYRAAHWARFAQKPLLPFTAFGGAAARIYEDELNKFDEKYAGLVDRREYEQLNSVKADLKEYAETIVTLAEQVAESHTAVVVMSYAERADLLDAFDSFKQVAKDLGYDCDRVTQKNTQGRILPEILDKLRGAAFVIVDLTDLRPNVFYELGYADGLSKTVIVTAKQGTELPFDVKDIPTIFWESQRQLRDDLKERIQNLVKTATPSVSTTIG
jgi:nucleoside 2-deoxyribosyltransferase